MPVRKVNHVGLVNGSEGGFSSIFNLEKEEARLLAMKKAKKELRKKESVSANKRPLTPNEKSAIAQDAIIRGLEPPETVGDAVKLKQLILAEERHTRMILEREAILRTRIPVELVKSFFGVILGHMNRQIDTIRSVFEEIPGVSEEVKVTLRKRAVQWADTTKQLLLETNIADVAIPPEEHNIPEGYNHVENLQPGLAGGTLPSSSVGQAVGQAEEVLPDQQAMLRSPDRLLGYDEGELSAEEVIDES